MPSRAIYLETFGCQMNELDSELVTGSLRALGYTFTPEPDAADVVLYNTCSVREHAEQKVWSRLGELKARKRREPGLVVGVLGCMAERDGEDLIRRMPVVDILCGPGELDRLPGLLDNAIKTRESLLGDSAPGVEGASSWGGVASADAVAFAGAGLPARQQGMNGRREASEIDRLARVARTSAAQVALQGGASRRSSTLAAAADSLELLDLSRSVSAVDHHGSAYVRITRGCNKFCTYCVVPFTRGAEIHRPPDHIVDECKRLADAGVVEVTLLGQTVNHYRFEHGAAVTVNGLTQPQKGRSYRGGHRRDPFASDATTTFGGLLARIHEEVPGIQRLRFVTSYPRDFGDDVLDAIHDHPRICRYLHVPGQSGSNRILQLMNRGYTVEEYLEFLDRARARLHEPEIGRPLTIAGDVIVGFPTETDEDFAQTRGLLERARYKNCFIFKYSARPGTTAYDKLADDVPDEVKRRRNNDLLALQGRISREVGEEYVGTALRVLVEGISQRDRKRVERAAAGATGHTHRQRAGISLTVRGRSVGGQDEAVNGSGACGTGQSSVFGAAEGSAEIDAADGPVQMSARTDGDLIVFFDHQRATEATALIGSIVDVRITESRALALHGELMPA